MEGRERTGPLEGCLVIEFADYVTGPFAAVLLAALGARVVKLERPPHGDPFRGWGEGGYSPTFCALNHTKESIGLDLQDARGRAVAVELCERADVFIENHRPGVAAGLGLGWDVLSRVNPRLVYCAISGFGPHGPYRERPGYDTIGQAMAGLLGLLTDRSEPAGMGMSLSDHLTGLFAAFGVVAALTQRERTGRGEHVETSLLRSTVAFVAENAARYFATGDVPTRIDRTRLAQVYAFVAGDGRPFVIHLSSPQKFFAGLATAVGLPALVDDPRFSDRRARIDNYEQLEAILAPLFRARPRADWLARLADEDVPAAPINDLQEVFADPQVHELGLVRQLTHPMHGSVRVVEGAVRFGSAPKPSLSAPPTLGQHTDSILAEVGMSADGIRSLRDAGVVL